MKWFRSLGSTATFSQLAVVVLTGNAPDPRPQYVCPMSPFSVLFANGAAPTGGLQVRKLSLAKQCPSYSLCDTEPINRYAAGLKPRDPSRDPLITAPRQPGMPKSGQCVKVPSGVQRGPPAGKDSFLHGTQCQWPSALEGGGNGWQSFGDPFGGHESQKSA